MVILDWVLVENPKCLVVVSNNEDKDDDEKQEGHQFIQGVPLN